jgi:DMSO/TMAO reductase YedYZ molybdopterin-dependent catalytic subunit
MTSRRLLAGATVLAMLGHGALAADTPPAPNQATALSDATLTVASAAGTVHFSLKTLQAQASESRQVTFQTEHGQESARYEGVPLLALLQHAGAASGAPKARLKRVITVTGRDGYTVALAWGEIDPDFEAEPVLLAYAKDGRPLPGGGLRLIVPGDKHGGRDVRDVTQITVD